MINQKQLQKKNYVQDNYPKFYKTAMHYAMHSINEKLLNPEAKPNYVTFDWDLITAVAPFARMRSAHRGYAETENIHDVDECLNLIKEAFISLNEPDKNGRRLYISALTKMQLTKQQEIRFKSNNGIYLGRLFARLHWLLNA